MRRHTIMFDKRDFKLLINGLKYYSCVLFFVFEYRVCYLHSIFLRPLTWVSKGRCIYTNIIIKSIPTYVTKQT